MKRSSGLWDLDGFKTIRSFVTPYLVTRISSMKRLIYPEERPGFVQIKRTHPWTDY